MNLLQANEIYQAILTTKCTYLVDNLVRASVRYARIRTDWALASIETRIDIDHERTIAHTAVVDCCNILSRNMVKAGENNSWRAKLGEDRKTIGDFACCLHCLLGIHAR